MHLSLDDLHELIGGNLRLGVMPPVGGDTTVVGRIVSDSREVEPDEVFWGLVGPRYNGAHFAEEAFVRGAQGVVTCGRWVEPWAGRWSLEVDDSLESLWELAHWSRRQFTAPLVAVTGSVGKTTARRMIDCVLSSRLTGESSPRNFNNHIGVPLSLLRLERWHQYGVIELGASGPGEIARLAKLAAPKIGVITRIGEAHLGGFGGEEVIAAEKWSLVEQLPADGCAVLNGDDSWLRKLAVATASRRVCQKIIWIGRGADADLAATHVENHAGQLRFAVDGDRYVVPVWGRHHLHSALAAVAIGRMMDLTAAQIASALRDFQPTKMRCQVIETGIATIVDDSYNSSPTALRAALDLVREIETPGKRIVVAGDMAELGAEAPQWHRQLGQEVVTRCGADVLVSCGEQAEAMAAAAVDAGMPRESVVACRHWEQAFPLLRQTIEPGDVVLVKGARAMALEHLVEALTERQQRAAA